MVTVVSFSGRVYTERRDVEREERDAARETSHELRVASLSLFLFLCAPTRVTYRWLYTWDIGNSIVPVSLLSPCRMQITFYSVCSNELRCALPHGRFDFREAFKRAATRRLRCPVSPGPRNNFADRINGGSSVRCQEYNCSVLYRWNDAFPRIFVTDRDEIEGRERAEDEKKMREKTKEERR